MISVINICYNTGSRILITLDSIKAQTFKEFEIIIADDASTDCSVELIEKWIDSNPAVNAHLMKINFNCGIPQTLNKALQLCKGKYVSIIGDDVWTPLLLEKQVSHLTHSDNGIALIFSKVNCLNVSENIYQAELNLLDTIASLGFKESDVLEPVCEDVYKMRNPELHHLLLRFNVVVVFTALIKKDILVSNGSFDEQYDVEDYPLWLKLSKKYEFLYLDKTLATYMRYPTNYSNTFQDKLELNVLKLLTNSYDKNLPVDTLVRLQTRFVLCFNNLLKMAIRMRKVTILRKLFKESIRFMCWPNNSTLKYIKIKIKKKLTKNNSAN